ncbi:MAG TPA: phosphate ABC transporter permease PstA [Anaerolineales bacterium]|nr:phosphate ABC transporter permease PstA [Anaerolineales bacterium]
MSAGTVSLSRFQQLMAQNQAARIARRKALNGVMLTLTGLLTVLALIPLFWIVGYVLYKGAAALSIAFFTQLPTPMGIPGGGVRNAIEGTIVITVLACLFAIPPGVLAAFYAARYPNTPLGVAVRFSTDVLSGVPSIVIGLFIYVLVVQPQGHYSALAGGIAVSLLMLPTIVRTTEEMLKLVPHSLREGSLALGAPEWKTSVSVLFPAALSGIITGFLLAISRAAGETAPLLFTALGNERYDIADIVHNGMVQKQGAFTILARIINQPADSLPLTLWKNSQQPFPERIQQSWAAALVLMVLALLINVFARVWVEYRRRKLQG